MCSVFLLDCGEFLLSMLPCLVALLKHIQSSHESNPGSPKRAFETWIPKIEPLEKASLGSAFRFHWCTRRSRHPVILSDNAEVRGVQSPPKRIVFPFHETILRR